MNSIGKKVIQEAVTTLREGGVVLFPTETAYGLAVDATNPKAVRRLQKLKGRPITKTFPLIASSTAMVERLGHLRCLGHRLAKAYWPGPLTMVMEAKVGNGLAKEVILNGTIAIRVSSHPIAAAMVKKLRAPITSTSANKAGEPTPYVVTKDLVQADYVINIGKLKKERPSTIIRIVDKKIETLRQGTLKPVDPKTV